MSFSPKTQHAKIESWLKEERKKFEKQKTEPSAILLGSADSGKSTLLRQLKLVNGIGFTDQEILNAKHRIERNLFVAVLAGIKDIAVLAINKDHGELVPIIEEAIKMVEFTAELKQKVSKLCLDEKVRKAIVSDKILPENSIFIDQVERIFDPKFLPSTQDILNMRDPTKSVTETIIPFKGNIIHIFDVSGLRQDRTKWLPYFDGVSSVLFVVSLSSFDRNLIEDLTVNQMRDALELYSNLCNSELLKRKHFTLIMNKMDLFKKKLETTRIQDYFKSFEGPNSYSRGIDYFRNKFYASRFTEGKQICHVTCCTDTNFMQKITATLIEAIVQTKLEEFGLI